MHRKQQEKVYQPEDLAFLVQHLPENLQDPVTQIHYNVMNHEAYNNTNYVWSKDDFELGTALGRGK
jgi:hypothetical protein